MTIEINADWKWALSGGWWYPEGATIIDPVDNSLVPRQFEPTGFDVLVDSRHVHAARRQAPMPDREWKFIAEIEEKERPVVPMPPPEALNPDEVKQPKAKPEKITPAAMRKRMTGSQ